MPARLRARRHIAKQHAAFAFIGFRRLDERHRHGFGWRRKILDDRVGDVFHQRSLGVERPALQEIDHNFRHHFLRVSNSHLTDTKCAPPPLRACLKCVFRLSEIGGVAQGSWIE